MYLWLTPVHGWIAHATIVALHINFGTHAHLLPGLSTFLHLLPHGHVLSDTYRLTKAVWHA